MLNDLIKWVYEQGLSGTFYWIIYFSGLTGAYVFDVLYGRKYGIRWWKSLCAAMFGGVCILVWIFLAAWIETGVFGGNNMVRGFAYLPLFLFAAAKIFKIEWRKCFDVLAPGICMAQGIGHIGCIFPGCCSGYPSSWGIYNIGYGATAFPTQLFEAFIALSVVVLLVLRGRSKGYKADGLACPLVLIFYGSTRFILEFARNNEKLWLGCSSLAFHALFMVVVGVVLYVIIKRINSAKPEIAEEALLNSENN